MARGTVADELTNRLYYGDNLDILRDHVPDASIDLVYLDPPFNSNRDYARIQILSVADLLECKAKPDLPTFRHQPFKAAERIYDPGGSQETLPL
jgi:DNA modification methylase